MTNEESGPSKADLMEELKESDSAFIFSKKNAGGSDMTDENGLSGYTLKKNKERKLEDSGSEMSLSSKERDPSGMSRSTMEPGKSYEELLM